MDLLNQVLQGVDDNRPLLQRMETSEALRVLVDEYNKFAQTLFEVPSAVTGLTEGRHFKAALRKLDPDAQLTLLKKYSDVLHGRHTQALENEKAEERKHRHWVVKATLIFVGCGILLIAGAMVAFAYKSGALPDSAVVSTIIKPALEILKLIFSVGVK